MKRCLILSIIRREQDDERSICRILDGLHEEAPESIFFVLVRDGVELEHIKKDYVRRITYKEGPALASLKLFVDLHRQAFQDVYILKPYRLIKLIGLVLARENLRFYNRKNNECKILWHKYPAIKAILFFCILIKFILFDFIVRYIGYIVFLAIALAFTVTFFLKIYINKWIKK